MTAGAGTHGRETRPAIVVDVDGKSHSCDERWEQVCGGQVRGETSGCGLSVGHVVPCAVDHGRG